MAQPLSSLLSAEVGRLAPGAAPLLVALSGGSDSVAALRLAHEAGLPLLAAHFDHRLRPASATDAAFARQLCAQLGVPFHAGSADVAQVAAAKGWNQEDAARRLRYAFLHRVLKEHAAGGVILVAHTLQDQTETVLLQLLRGAAYPVGMRARRGAIIRPLLGAHREQLRAYLRGLGQEWREDDTNQDTSLNRAWLRHQIVPQLQRRYPAVAQRMADTALAQQEARDALVQLASKRFPEPVIRVASWRRVPVAIRKTALAQRLQQAGAASSAKRLRRIDQAALDAADRGAGAPPWRLTLPGGAEASVAYGQLSVTQQPAAATPTAPQPVLRPEQLPDGVPAELLELHPNLVLRTRAPGDRIRLPAGAKLLSDLLIDRKVPRQQRDQLQVLAAGSQLFWVEGVALASDLAGAAPELDPDRRHMRTALQQARLAAAAGEVPIGAVVVGAHGRILAAAHNRTEEAQDPTAHAELLALRAAAAASGDWRLAGATLYVTLEPCPMCLGAVLQTHLTRLVFGADNLRDGALGGVTDIRAAGWKRVPVVRGGVEAKAAADLLKATFGPRRQAR